jgi:hypothetical protein
MNGWCGYHGETASVFGGGKKTFPDIFVQFASYLSLAGVPVSMRHP